MWGFTFGSLWLYINSKGFTHAKLKLAGLRYGFSGGRGGRGAAAGVWRLRQREGENIKDLIVVRSLKGSGQGAKCRRYNVSSDVESILVIGHRGGWASGGDGEEKKESTRGCPNHISQKKKIHLSPQTHTHLPEWLYNACMCKHTQAHTREKRNVFRLEPL